MAFVRWLRVVTDRYENEVARHKALDALGDLALGGTIGMLVCV